MGISLYMFMVDTSHSTERTLVSETDILYLFWADRYYFLPFMCMYHVSECLYACASLHVSMGMHVPAAHAWQSEKPRVSVFTFPLVLTQNL